MSHPQPSHDKQEEEEEEEYHPWYSDPTNQHPFKLVRKINLGKPDAPAFRALAIFPWDSDSLNKLWNGHYYSPETQNLWQNVIAEYWDAVAVTSDYSLYIFWTQQKRSPLSVKLPEDTQKLLETDMMCISWAISMNEPLEPLVLFSRGSLLYTYSPVRLGIRSYIRGHGGPITCIAAHPTNPHLICTTSRDYSTRIYNLNLDADIPVPDSVARTIKTRDEKVDNPVWPPNQKPSLAGAAHGLRLPTSEQEGMGKGRCICVLMGGRSGGHQAAVLAAAFHPTLPLVATCGMDRAVKIWPVRPISETMIKREDKPLFSSTRVHRARVMSISWLQDDLLLTHSAPAIMRKDPDSPTSKETYVEPGELTIWRWLSLFRFFPTEEIHTTNLRGISSDFQESSSFKIISTHAFPPVPSQLIAPRLSLYHTPIHDPLILLLYPKGTSFTLANAKFMKPRKPYPFPRRVTETLLGTGDAPPPPPSPPSSANGASSADPNHPFAIPETQPSTPTAAEPAEAPYVVRVSGPDEELDNDDDDDDDDNTKGPAEAPEDDGDGEEGEGLETDEEPLSVLRRPAVEVPPIRGWIMGIEAGEGGRDAGKRMMGCAMGVGGRIIVGVGTQGSIWVWRNDE